MKNMKKVVSFLLAFVMVFAMNFTTAFATEVPKNNMKQNDVTNSGDEGIMPCVYDYVDADIRAQSSTTLSGINIPERYAGFEATASVMGGGTNSGTYTVHFQQYDVNIAGISFPIDNQSHKKDWIDLSATNTSCGFKMVNNSNVDIHIHIVYYSWN